MPIWLLVISAFLPFVLISMVGIACENERFTISALGRYRGLRGLGLVLKSPDLETKWVNPFVVGDRGELVAPGVAGFIRYPSSCASRWECESWLNHPRNWFRFRYGSGHDRLRLIQKDSL